MARDSRKNITTVLLCSFKVICLLFSIKKWYFTLHHTMQAKLEICIGFKFGIVARTLLPSPPLCYLILKTQQL